MRASRGKLDCEPCEVSQCVTYLPRGSGGPGRQAGAAGVCAILCSPPHCGPGGNLVFKGKGRSGENGEVGAALTSDLGHCPARTHVPVGYLLSGDWVSPFPAAELETREPGLTRTGWFAEGPPCLSGRLPSPLRVVSSGPHDTLQCRKTLPVGSGA